MVRAHRLRVGCNEPCVTTMDVVKMLNYSEIMRTLEDQMSTYAAYHQDARNKATHFVGVPVIVLSLMIRLTCLEARRPALADNLFQIFVAPIFLCAELFFALGYKPKLHSAVEERAKRLR